MQRSVSCISYFLYNTKKILPYSIKLRFHVYVLDYSNNLHSIHYLDYLLNDITQQVKDHVFLYFSLFFCKSFC